MNRKYSIKSIPFIGRNNLKKIGLSIFMILVAFQILTPPSNNIIIKSPNNKKEARLKTFFYSEDIPSYKIYIRETGSLLWRNLLYLPSYTNSVNPNVELKWLNDSSLCFQINNVIVWESKEF